MRVRTALAAAALALTAVTATAATAAAAPSTGLNDDDFIGAAYQLSGQSSVAVCAHDGSLGACVATDSDD